MACEHKPADQRVSDGARRILSSAEAAERMGISRRTLEDWRRKWRRRQPGEEPPGPPFIELSPRKTGYLEADVDAWLESRRVD